MTDTTSTDSHTSDSTPERDERWRERCCLCLFFPWWRDMSLALASLLLMIFVGFWVISDGVFSYLRAIEHPGWMTLVRRTTNAIVFQVEGFDKQNRRGLFDIVVLKKQFLWVRSSSDQLERNGVVLPLATVSDSIFDRDMRLALENALDIVAVGTASEEGTAETEVARANRRAHETAKLVKSNADMDAPIWTLNLGQYMQPCSDCEANETNWQRPFIVIAVVSKEDGLNLKEALQNAMSGRSELPSPRRYSNFDLGRYR